MITVAGAVVGALSPGRRPNQGIPAGLQRWSATHALPNADAAVIPAPGTRPEYTPLEQHYRIDINTIPPAVDASQWSLKIGGLVEQPLSLTLDDLRQYEPTHQFITLACISNPVGRRPDRHDSLDRRQRAKAAAGPAAPARMPRT